MDDEASILSERVMTRWEALEACEKIFHGTRVRVSADNVGLARHPDGLELVWIGEPLRQEFAAWRYGDQFGRRRKRQTLVGVGIAAVFGGVIVGGAVTGIISGAVLGQSGIVTTPGSTGAHSGRCVRTTAGSSN